MLSIIMVWIKRAPHDVDDSLQPYARGIVTAIVVVQPAMLLLTFQGLLFNWFILIAGLNFAIWLHYAPTMPPKAKPSLFICPSIPLQIYSSVVTWTGVALLLVAPPF